MRILWSIFVFGISAHTSLAQSPMTASEFEAYTQGRTIYYGDGLRPLGGESYLRNRNVIWSYREDRCLYGQWYPSGPNICFDYEELEAPHCWQFFLKDGGLTAVYASNNRSTLYELSEEFDLLCEGPFLGS